MPKLKRTIEEVRRFAEKKGGSCLSEGYAYHDKLLFRCVDGHEWWADFDHAVRRGQWCPACAGRRHTKEELDSIAKGRGGECLSLEYRGAFTKHLWRCANGHVWRANPNKIFQRRWCPVCASGYGERVCRAVFEHVFLRKFPRCRPLWLRSPKGFPMELDGFNEELGLAFEYNGEQHYADGSSGSFWSCGYSERRAYDLHKLKLCESIGIKLVVVPYSVRFSGLQDFVVGECRRLGLHVRDGLELLALDECGYLAIDRINEVRDVAGMHGGACISEKFMGVNAKYRFRCAHGHEWDARFTNIRRGHWCPYCAGNGRITVDILRVAGRRNGYELLVAGSKPKGGLHRWRCRNGHAFLAGYDVVLRDNAACHACRREVVLGVRELRWLFRCFYRWTASDALSLLNMPGAYKMFPWEPSEEEYLRLVYHSEGVAGFLRRFPYRSYSSVKNRACALGLRLDGQPRRWTADEVEVMMMLYPLGGWKKVHGFLPGRSECSIKSEAMKLGIRFDAHVVWNKGRIGYLGDEARHRMSAAHKGKRCSISTEFWKGIVPWNKGGRMSAESCARMSASARGRVPWNKGLRLTAAHRKNLVLGHLLRKQRFAGGLPPRKGGWMRLQGGGSNA